MRFAASSTVLPRATIEHSDPPAKSISAASAASLITASAASLTPIAPSESGDRPHHRRSGTSQQAPRRFECLAPEV
jgi:hypothetical protein